MLSAGRSLSVILSVGCIVQKLPMLTRILQREMATGDEWAGTLLNMQSSLRFILGRLSLPSIRRR